MHQTILRRSKTGWKKSGHVEENASPLGEIVSEWLNWLKLQIQLNFCGYDHCHGM